eukprot:CAMPEP_0194402994 /NCGR_PEP_ID=MMETSP0176-20130528/1667_1 /TAXON_ID=216777 /ORGANISM="Proboscia alata, Strain PI-D3" /LENGTH=238 /DNA_ID=CAMNT_0039200617 /DNA_START=41 /DNA_END=757 /DNA_ORIENTATION=-
MKTACIFSLLIASVSSFTNNIARCESSTLLKAASDDSLIYSTAVPFLERPKVLDGKYAGDAGFDPLSFAKTETDLLVYREAEIKHARLAMLAAAGWPISELYDAKLASFANMPSLLDGNGRVPSLLNGGMEKVPVIYWLVCLIAASAIDVYGLRKTNGADYIPGNLGMDPFGVSKSPRAIEFFRTAEIKNGRLAMIAITLYALLEFSQSTAIVNTFPYLFQPLSQTVSNLQVASGMSS